MAIEFTCTCGKQYVVEDSRAGKFMLCSGCHHKIKVPGGETGGAGQKPCPVCHASVDMETLACLRCGYNFEIGGAAGISLPKSRQGDRRPALAGPKSPDGRTLRVMAVGFGVTVAAMLLSQTQNFFLCLPVIVLDCFGTLCHEFGHALFAWIFGCPSIPAFDFQYGGGVAVRYDRSFLVLVAVYVVFALLLWLARSNRLALIALGSILVLHVVCAFTSLHQLVILFMGHGTELLFAGLFLYRSWTGYSTFHEQERIAYAICGSFFAFDNFVFSYNLFSSLEARIEYGLAKGGGHWMDFDRIARMLDLDLTTVALFFCFCCLIPVLASFLLFRYQDYCNKFLSRLTRVEV